MTYTREQIAAAVKAKGYTYFTGPGNYDVNIVGPKGLCAVLENFLKIIEKV